MNKTAFKLETTKIIGGQSMKLNEAYDIFTGETRGRSSSRGSRGSRRSYRDDDGTYRPDGYDRIDVNESDGQVFYGFDDKESGRTTWYDQNGSPDCITDTPSDD